MGGSWLDRLPADSGGGWKRKAQDYESSSGSQRAVDEGHIKDIATQVAGILALAEWLLVAKLQPITKGAHGISLLLVGSNGAEGARKQRMRFEGLNLIRRALTLRM